MKATGTILFPCTYLWIALLSVAGPFSPLLAAELPQSPVDVLAPVPGGRFTMGAADGEPDERPQEVATGPFQMMQREVTNALFAAFVSDSGHVTDPERRGFGYVWDGRWRREAGATWQHPQGPEDNITGKDQHPVVQVSQRDAAAYCRWYGLRLPSELEWEFAARGLDGRRYPWGDQPPEQAGLRRANYGTTRCCAPEESDGYRTTAPVGSFGNGASPFGLLDMAGNVWEWTNSRFPGRPDQVVLRGGGWGNNPYCLRVSYRHGNPPDIGLDMVGFRCAGQLDSDPGSAGGSAEAGRSINSK